MIIDSVLKTNPWTHKIKDLTEKKIIGTLYGKNGYYMSILLISYYLESDSHVRYKIKVLLDLDHATDVDTEK